MQLKKHSIDLLVGAHKLETIGQTPDDCFQIAYDNIRAVNMAIRIARRRKNEKIDNITHEFLSHLNKLEKNLSQLMEFVYVKKLNGN